MPSIRTLQTSFVTGQIDENLFGRVDTDIYAKGAAELTNVYVRPQGGVARREGLEYIATIAGDNKRVIPFEFNNEQVYILVFTDNNGGEMTVVTADDGVVQTTVSAPEFVVFDATTLAELNYTQSADTLLLVHNSFQPLKIVRTSDTVWSVEVQVFDNIPTFAYDGITVSNPNTTIKFDTVTGNAIATLGSSSSLTTPSGTTDTNPDATIDTTPPNFVGGSGTMTLSDNATGFVFDNTMVDQLIIVGTAEYRITDVLSSSQLTYEVEVLGSPTFPATTTNWILQTGYVRTTGFTGASVGQYINTNRGGRAQIKAVQSSTKAEVNIVIELEDDAAESSGVASGEWELEEGYEPVMSDTRGWAGVITFFKGRLWLGNVGQRPQTILGSKIGFFFDLDIGTTLADEGIDITIDDDRVNRIVNFFPGRGLQIFTTGGEFVILSNIQEPITPNNIADQLEKQTLHGSGSSSVNTVEQTPIPVSVDGTTVFVEVGGAVVRQFVFNETEQSFNANNISILSSEIIRNPKAMAIRKAVEDLPNDYLYIVNNDGTCAVLNSLREQDLLAWSLFTTEGTFEDVAVSGRQAYFLVNREINGSTVTFLERLNADHFMDASVLQTSGTATDAWSGLTHLDTETVRVRGDDYILEDEVVAAGAITSSELVSKLEAGLNYSARVTTLPLDTIIDGQPFLGQFKAPRWMNTRLLNSRNVIVEYGTRRYFIPFRTFGEDVLDDPIVPSDEWKKVYLGGFDREVQVTLTQDDPLEFNIIVVVFGVKI